MGLAATTALDELCSLANHLSGVQSMFLDKVLTHHHREQGLVLILRTDDTEQRTLDGSLYLEHQVLSGTRIHGQHATDDLHAIDVAGLLDELLTATHHGLLLEGFNLLLHCVVFLDILLYNTL